ncbi:MAG: citramalate synthase [Phycisphaeraceae bacterium]|nr:citramalate synthase [Phycisphaeraceae bacterium]
MSQTRRIEIYDTTLRDGTQGEGVSLSLVDKLKITQRLDAMGFDYIEGGYPLSNPKDVAYFEQAAKLNLKHAKVCAFGMTRRRGVDVADDPGMRALVQSGAPVITIVGKTWDLHVDEVLRVEREENLAMIADSVRFCRESGREVFYDAEHFFDGLKANRDYALATLKAAHDAGATRVILCDTNGGSLPHWVADATRLVRQELGRSVRLGIHTHNDGGLAMANSLAAVEEGAMQVQGTINGIGERCGNVDLTTVIANLRLKLGLDCLNSEALGGLTELSRYVYELANLNLVAGQPFVGPSAFAHKGGMHVHAVNRLAESYEHVRPDAVGNTRKVLVSELSGVSNLQALLGEKYRLDENRELQRKVINRIQDLEHVGYQFEAAGASLELLVRQELGTRMDFWDLDHYRCVIHKVDHREPCTEAIVKLRVAGAVEHRVAEGDGPVNALDSALRKCLEPHYADLGRLHLRDYKVRVVNARAETAATVRVIVDFAIADPDRADRYFSTVGVSENIVEASWKALIDAFEYHLLEAEARMPVRAASPRSPISTA